MRICGCEKLDVVYRGGGAEVHALADVNLDIVRGETAVVVGESGCGKTTLGGFFTGTLSEDSRVTFGAAALPESSALIRQEAKNSLHPLIRIGDQLRDCCGDKRTACRLLEEVELDPGLYYRSYPHQLSGGQAQRAVIARALAVGADLIVADEPTANLDPLTREKVIRLLYSTVERHGRTCLLITHDLGIARKIADRLIVMAGGRIIESGPADKIFRSPQKPYTRQFIESSEGVKPLCVF